MKKNKSELEDINKRFHEEIINCTRSLNNLLKDFVNNKLEKEKLDMVINSEKKCDRIKERYIELLYEEKRALPFLIQDRYKIITSVDKIGNRAEYIARYMGVFPFKIYDEIREGFSALNDLFLHAVEKIVELTILMETDFNGAYKLTFELETIKRNAHDLKFVLLNLLFKKTDNPLKVNLTWKLISLLYDGISWTEEISDYLRGLILKYPSQ